MSPEESNQQSAAVSYQYDEANRLTSVGGVSYSYDNNGNLLSDGTNAYTYDAANRLISVTGPSGTTTYAYNGLGDRLQETVNDVTTTYLMDLASNLSQVLDDGTTSYTYGVNRIAQTTGADTEYFLGDALDSVRQLTDSTSAVTLAKNYDPFGNVETSAGSGSSIFGYTNEQTDSTGMVYLRARYYDPSVGRFMTRDTWKGSDFRPPSYNKWQYSSANPINFSDPSGMTTTGDCMKIPNNDAQQVCLKSAGCDLCVSPPEVNPSTDTAQLAYQKLVSKPCKQIGNQLYPWWKTSRAQQQVPASMDATMLVAILIYTEGSPVRPMQAVSNEVRDTWIEMLQNRLNFDRMNFGGKIEINQGGRQLSDSLSQFLRWSDKFWRGSQGYIDGGSAIDAIYNKIYGEPDWAYSIADRVVTNAGSYDPQKPMGGFNAQSKDEADYFLNKYLTYGKLSHEEDGVYYMWGSGANCKGPSYLVE